MIIECLVDMRAFIILLFYAFLAFDFLFINSDLELGPIDGFADSFLVFLGDWDSEGFNFGQ